MFCRLNPEFNGLVHFNKTSPENGKINIIKPKENICAMTQVKLKLRNIDIQKQLHNAISKVAIFLGS